MLILCTENLFLSVVHKRLRSASDCVVRRWDLNFAYNRKLLSPRWSTAGNTALGELACDWSEW